MFITIYKLNALYVHLACQESRGELFIDESNISPTQP